MGPTSPKDRNENYHFAEMRIKDVSFASSASIADQVVNGVTIEFLRPLPVCPGTTGNTKCISEMTLGFASTPAAGKPCSVKVENLVTLDEPLTELDLVTINELTFEFPAPVPVECGAKLALGAIREVTLCFPEVNRTAVTGKIALGETPGHSEFNNLIRKWKTFPGACVPPTIIDPALPWTGKK